MRIDDLQLPSAPLIGPYWTPLILIAIRRCCRLRETRDDSIAVVNLSSLPGKHHYIHSLHCSRTTAMLSYIIHLQPVPLVLSGCKKITTTISIVSVNQISVNQISHHINFFISIHNNIPPETIKNKCQWMSMRTTVFL